MKLHEFLMPMDREYCEGFARRIGTTYKYLNLLRHGHRRPRPERALKIHIETNGMVDILDCLYPDSDLDSLGIRLCRTDCPTCNTGKQQQEHR